MLTRRELLQRSAILSLSPAIPAFLAQTARAVDADLDRRVLVVVQLDGGNDGLNTVVPFHDEHYARLRPQLKLPTDKLVKLNDDVALHPAMTAMGKLFDAGRLSVIQNVGYPNPNRSHFVSMAIWQSALLDTASHGQYGWLGRALDVQAARQTGPHAVYAGLGSAPVTLWGRKTEIATLNSLEEMALATPVELFRATANVAADDADLVRIVARASEQAFTTAERLSSLLKAPAEKSDAAYPGSQLAANLKLVAALLKSDSKARVFYTLQSGYDTHATQANTHYNLLREFSEAVSAFSKDMDASGLGERVLVLAFSEFGRRAAENNSGGTDHGAAGPVFVAGPKLAQGLHGTTPNLADLDEGDVKMAIDFRQIYASILDRWLDVPAAKILSGNFEPLPLLG